MRAEPLGPARRRPMVLDVALQLLVERGLAGVSMDAIAKAAGVSKPVIYSCFPSRAELLTALLEREEERLFHVAAAMPDRPTLEDPEGGLRAGFTAFLSAVAAEPDSWRLILLSQHGSDPDIRRRVVRGRKLLLEREARLVAMQLAAAGVDDAERKAEAVAGAIMAAGEYAAGLLLEKPEKWTPAGLAELLARVFVRGAGRV